MEKQLKTVKYKIFDYCWHIPHQYDMVKALKDDCDFFYCLNTKQQWDSSKRALPPEIRFVSHYERGLYDLAILHIDQNVIDEHHQKRRIYDEFNSVIDDIPKVVINHGTPVFPEFFWNEKHLTLEEMEKECKRRVRSIVGPNTMVVNSFCAASEKEWGFGIPIVHGMDVAEWMDLPKEPRVFTALSLYGFQAYYNRKCMIDVYDLLYDRYGYILAYANLNIDTRSSVDFYRDYLGRSLIYLDTSFRTPMNRARTEAFLSGCCVVQVEGAHDLERWAKDGENIIIVPNDPAQIVEVLVDLLENRIDEAREIGQNGKKTAMENFNPERYRKDWISLLIQLTHES